MIDEPDYILDISSQPVKEGSGRDAEKREIDPKGRNFISIMFECCNVYQRIYKNKAGTAYEGRCPKCMRPVTIKVGPGGSSNRIFRAT